MQAGREDKWSYLTLIHIQISLLLNRNGCLEFHSEYSMRMLPSSALFIMNIMPSYQWMSEWTEEQNFNRCFRRILEKMINLNWLTCFSREMQAKRKTGRAYSFTLMQIRCLTLKREKNHFEYRVNFFWIFVWMYVEFQVSRFNLSFETLKRDNFGWEENTKLPSL